MTSVDFCHPIPPLLGGDSIWLIARLPQVKSTIFIPQMRCIYFHTFRMAIGLRVSWPPHSHMAASYTVIVRRARILTTASFRSRIAPDILAVRLTVPAIGVRKGLAPPNHQLDTTSSCMVLKYHTPCQAPGALKKAGPVRGRLLSAVSQIRGYGRFPKTELFNNPSSRSSAESIRLWIT